MSLLPENSPFLANLNEPQREAVQHRDGPLLVLAGPGSGKTRVITRRVAQLVHTGVSPHNILAITFTNKAADEMKARIDAMGIARGAWVYTFHALGVRLLREFGPLAEVQPGFTIYDVTDQKRLVKEAMSLCKVNDQIVKPDRVLNEISRAKNQLETPKQLKDISEAFEMRIIANIYDAYEQLLRQRNAVDFDDLLMRVAIVLRDHPDVTERLNIRFHYLLIDEYQDTNHAQYLIAKSLSKHHHNICATGDPDQSIYAWRGADIRNILEFEHDFPDAKIVRLEENYRSTKNILRVASKLIACNKRRKHKDLWTHNDEGEPVSVWEFAEGRDEAERVASTIDAMCQEGRSYKDFAITYRVNAISRGLEEALRLHDIPYRIARGVEFYNRKEIRDTLAYLRVIVNPADDLALLRIINTPIRGIGATTIKRLTEFAEEKQTPLINAIRNCRNVPKIKTATKRVEKFAQILDQIEADAHGSVEETMSSALRLSGMEEALAIEDEEQGEDRLANVKELVTAAKIYDEETPEPSLEDFLQRVTLTSDQDTIDENADCVLLLTLHAAKGLEFPVIFLVGMEDGLLPHERSIQTGDIEEERRLCFVGITRAKKQLFLSHARQRYIRGQLTPRPGSQFLMEIPDDAITPESFGLPSWKLKQEKNADGFIPTNEHIADEDVGFIDVNERPRKRSFNKRYDNPDETFIDVSADMLKQAKSPYADWGPGTFVTHDRYGVGQIQWIRPNAGQTRASVRFTRAGEKVFILEISPIRKLER